MSPWMPSQAWHPGALTTLKQRNRYRHGMRDSRFHSPTLLKACSMTVLVPEGSVGTPPFPVCYLLHGLSDDHTSWARQTSLERHVAGCP